ncbi:MAG: hypothetical protein JWR08_417 [Enterovirga sp.]|jgi:hypothetical protein|nr:hypothetical protein [Enterovirga sp.]
MVHLASRFTVLSAAAFLMGATAAQAQSVSSSRSDVAAARANWAERHVALVCRPLAERGLPRRAAACFARARVVMNDAAGRGEPTGSIGLPPSRSANLDRPAPASAASRCSGVACLQLFSSLGVGF